jgi:hypothetical protein
MEFANSEATSLMALAKRSLFFSQKLLIDSRLLKAQRWRSRLVILNLFHTRGRIDTPTLVSRYPRFGKGLLDVEGDPQGLMSETVQLFRL